MRKMIVILLLCSSCVSTEKLLETKPAYQVRDIEAKKFKRGKHRPNEILAWSLFIFSVASFTDYVVKDNKTR